MKDRSIELSVLDERITTVAKQEAAKKEAKQDIYYQFDDYIKTKERKVSKATLIVYGNVKAHLQAFEKYRQESSQKSMSSQFVMTYPGRRPNSALPHAFTEQGVAIKKREIATEFLRKAGFPELFTRQQNK